MKKIYLLLLIAFPACKQPVADVNDILTADKNFSALCMQKGMAESFVEYAADDVVKLRPQEFPIIGKENLKAMFAEHLGNDLKFSWEPVKGDIAASGDLGYTFGNWKIFIKGSGNERDTTLYGNYVSIWKKQKDGSWKYVLDGGNATPSPGSAN